MTDASVLRTANLLAALCLHVTSTMASATRRASERSETDTVALVTLAAVTPGASQDALARLLGLSQSGVTRLIDRLAGDGMVRRDPGPDQRTVAVHTTAAGHQLAEQALAAREQTSLACLEVLTADDRLLLDGLLEKLLNAAVHERADAFRICRMCDAAVCHDLDRCPVTDAARAVSAAPSS